MEKLLTQTEVAELAGLHVSTVNRVEKGTLHSIKAIRRIAAALGVKDVVKTEKRRTA